MSFIEQKEIFDKTDGGRLVIEAWYPSSAESFNNTLKKFKARDKDKTPSCSLKRQPDGVWVVTDFGGDGKPRNAIAIVMLEESCDFKTAIQIIAARFNIVPDAKAPDLYKPEIRQRDAEPNEEDGKWYFETKDFSMAEVITILAPKVWEYLIRIAPKPSDVPKDESIESVKMDKAMEEAVKVFRRYHLHSLKSYTIVKNRKATIVECTEHYPIFMFDEGKWKKIYQPKNLDAGRRFMHYGGRPTDFIFGYEQANKAYQEITRIEEDDAPIADEQARNHKKEKDKKKPAKIAEIIITAGGSDGLNIACIGQCFKGGKAESLATQYFPVWMNSETAKLTVGQFKNLAGMCEKVYNLPDIDATGRREAHALALEHLELHTINLPAELLTKSDNFRNKPCKDLRDYFKYWTPYDFFKLFKTAYPYRFWDVQPKFNKQGEYIGIGYAVNNKYMLNFLQKNGFYRFATDSEKDNYFYIHIQNNVVRKVEPKKIRDFINGFIESRNPDVELMNVFLRSTQLNEGSLSNLAFVEVDFNDFDRETQWMFFHNRAIKVTKEKIEEFRPGETDKYVWEDEVIANRFTPLPDLFSITATRNEKDGVVTTDYDIKIHNNDCLVMRTLINTSRIYWRAELEERLEGIPAAEREDHAMANNFAKDEMALMEGLPRTDWKGYREKHKFDLCGPLLTAHEQKIQKQNFINKCFAIGHMLHRYKSPSKAWAIWSMDAKLTDGDESHGGTGKSIVPTLLSDYKIIKGTTKNGRDKKLTENTHVFEGITEHIDMLLIDDADQYLKLDFFFPAITGNLAVNPKNISQYSIPFALSPKLWITANYPPHNIDPSKERRLLYTLNSDYYHHNKMGEYREDKSVRDDHGKDLGRDFDENDWNLFYNFLLQCLRFYMGCTEKINPPMDDVNRRNMIAGMGETFQSWADVYFSLESGNINVEGDEGHFVEKQEAFQDFVKGNKSGWSMRKFSSALKLWCHFNRYQLNPSDVKGYVKDKNSTVGRIVHKVKVRDSSGAETDKSITKDMVYIRATRKVATPEPEELMPF